MRKTFDNLSGSTVAQVRLVLLAILLFSAMFVLPAFAQSAAPAPPAPGPSVDVPAEYVIGSEDVLGIVFWRDADMTGDVTVRPDGKITLPLIGDIVAVRAYAGVASGLDRESRYEISEGSERYRSRSQINSRKVFITGEVTTPGAYPLAGPRTVMQLIALAGGLTEYADKKNITISEWRTVRPRAQVQLFRRREGQEPGAEHRAEAWRHRDRAIGEQARADLCCSAVDCAVRDRMREPGVGPDGPDRSGIRSWLVRRSAGAGRESDLDALDRAVDAAGGRNTVPVDLAPTPTDETIAETAVNATVTTQVPGEGEPEGSSKSTAADPSTGRVCNRGVFAASMRASGVRRQSVDASRPPAASAFVTSRSLLVFHSPP